MISIRLLIMLVGSTLPASTSSRLVHFVQSNVKYCAATSRKKKSVYPKGETNKMELLVIFFKTLLEYTAEG